VCAAPVTCREPLALAGADAPGVVDGPALLDALERGEPPPAGEVVVLCGGEAGFECARALRQRGCSVTVVCRRVPGEPPACADRLEALAREGIQVEPAAVPAEIIRRGGRVRWLRLVRTPPAQPARDFVLPADLLVLGGAGR